MGVAPAGSEAGRRGGRPTAAQTARLDQAIREAALARFLADGYEGTSMDVVARDAGTTKATLYTRFRSKEEMFGAVLEWATQQQDWPAPEPDHADVDEVHDLDGLARLLREIAHAAVRRTLHPQMVQLTRLAVAQGTRVPVLAEHSRLSPWRRYDVLVGLLSRLQAEAVIGTDLEPGLLAENFFAMVSGMPARLALFGVVRPDAEQARRTDAAVRLFVDGLRGDR